MKKFTFFILALFISVGAFSQGKAKSNRTNDDIKESTGVLYEKNAIDQCQSFANIGSIYNLNHIQIFDKSSRGNRSAVLLDNGPIVTDAGAGAGGADVSLVQTGNGSLGFSHSIGGFFMVAEDFMVNATSWTVDSIAFFAYQTNSTLTSTFTTYHVVIWDGVPGVGNIVWGDTVTNRLSSTSFSNTYRGSTLTGTTRPIMRTFCATPGLVLSGGSYWIGWRAAGSLTSGPWANPITIQGQLATGNAKQLSGGVWGNIADGTSTEQQGLPFIVYGTEVAATCPFPASLNASNITTTTADLSWTESGSATAWDVEFGSAGFTPTGVPTNSVTAQTLSVASLTANTSYDFYVRADCGADQSIWVGPYTFSTLACEVANQCNYTLVFNDSFGDGWNGCNVDILQNGISVGVYTLSGGATGTQFVGICDAFTIDLVFNSGSYPDETSFSIVNPFGDTLFTFADGSLLTDGATFYSFTSSCTPPACAKPTTLAASNITTNGADISWVEAGTATLWDVEYGEKGFTPTGTPTNSGLTSQALSLSSLTSATSYDVYVRADCGGSQSAWTGPYSFTTACNAVSSLPYTEGFEGATFPPVCWSVLDANTDGKTWITSTGYANTGTNAACYPYSATVAGDDWLFTNGIDLQTGITYQVKFYYRVRSATYAENLKLSFGNNNDAAAMTNTVVDLAGITNITYSLSETNFTVSSNGVYYFGFYAYSPMDMWNIYVDDVTIDIAPACAKPSSLNASNFSTSSADISWTNGGSETAWNVEYGQTGYTQGAGTTLVTSTNPYTLSGLIPATTYDVYVQADCGADQSTWTGPFTFTTLCADVTSFPYTEDFEGMTTDFICWNVFKNTAADGGLDGSNLVSASTGAGDDTWFVLDPTGFSNAGANYIHGGTHAAALGYTAPDFNWLISGNIVLPAANFYALKYWTWRKDSIEAAWTTKFYVQVYADGIWNNVLSYTDGTHTNELASEEVIDLTPFAGKTIKVAFVFEYNDGYEMSIDDIIIDQTTNSSNIEDVKSIGIYPNPTTGIVNIRNAENSNVYVYDILGNTVARFNNMSSVSKIDLSNLSEGNYVIKVVSEKESINQQITIVK